MKATDKVYEALANILKDNGMELEDSRFGKQIKGGEYVGYQVWDRHDAYEGEGADMECRGHIEVTASICRMGGEMTAEDFEKAAAEMQTAQRVLEAIAAADLSYVSDINGEEVAA